MYIFTCFLRFSMFKPGLYFFARLRALGFVFRKNPAGKFSKKHRKIYMGYNETLLLKVILMTMIDELNALMLNEFDQNEIEDTLTNRITFLNGVRDAWDEDTSKSLEKAECSLELTVEINRLQFKMITTAAV